MIKQIEQYSETRFYTALYENQSGNLYEIQWEETENLDQDWPIIPVILSILREDGESVPEDSSVWKEVAEELEQLVTNKVTL